MDSARWARVDALFEQAVDLAPSERDAFLARECAGDDELHEEVRSLIACEPHADHVVGSAVWAAAAAQTSREPNRFKGTERFEIRRKLGAGGFGTVYEAYDRELNIAVAVKALHRAGPAAVHQFKREFRTLADIAHENVARLYELFSQAERWFFSMELVDGGDFVSAIQMAPKRARELFIQLARGVLALHNANILHCDLKPSNVLVSSTGRVVILDFGLARETTRTLDAEAHFGTPAYIAPERVAGLAPTRASDWYSAGVMLYEALSGVRAFTGSTRTMLGRRLLEDPVPLQKVNPAVLPDLARLCMDLLQRDPSWRPSGEEILARLELAGESLEPQTRSAEQADLFVGREYELRSLYDALAAAETGAVVQEIAGPPGVGKTTLVRRFLTLCQKDDVLVLAGRCRERESVPFKALDDAMDDMLRYMQGMQGREREELLSSDAAYIRKLFPSFPVSAGVPPEYATLMDAVELRQRAFDAFGSFVRRWTQGKRLVCWIDDAQCSDGDSAALLAHVLDSPERLPILLILSFRGPEANNGELLTALDRVRDRGQPPFSTRRLDLGCLLPSEATELARRLISQSANDHAVSTIVREAGCHPYLITELAGSGLECGPISTEAGVLDEVMQRRIAALPVTARAMLRVAALANRAVAWHVARMASGDMPDSYDALLLLRSRRLVRSSQAGTLLDIEIYHDRVAEVVRSSISPDEKRRIHYELALQYERFTPHDVESLAWHYSQAGDHRRAAPHALAAGHRAASAMAFETAASYYRIAQAGASEAGLSCAEIQRKMAEALANAGRAAEAAEVFLHLADGEKSMRGIDLRISAARHFLASGHIESGLRVIESVLDVMGMRMARTPWLAMASAVSNRGRAWLLRRYGANALSPQSGQFARIEACWTVVFGLGLVEPVHAADFQGRHLVLVLRFGNELHLARALAMESVFLAIGGRRFWRASERMLEQAFEISRRRCDAQTLALTNLAAGIAMSSRGMWQSAFEHLEDAGRLFRQTCQGANWELATVRLGASRALYYRGDIRTLCERLPAMWKEAEARGDVYESTPLRARLSILELLTSDDAANPKASLIPAASLWPTERYCLQHYWLLVAELDMDFYAGQYQHAWDLLGVHWQRLKRARLLNIRYIRIEALSRRALTAVALCRADPKRRELLLGKARRDGRALEGENTLWSNAAARAVWAAIALENGEKLSAVELLRSCEGAFMAADMASLAAAARWHRGSILRNEEGSELIEAACLWMRGQRIVNPARAARMLIPIVE